MACGALGAESQDSLPTFLTRTSQNGKGILTGRALVPTPPPLQAQYVTPTWSVVPRQPDRVRYFGAFSRGPVSFFMHGMVCVSRRWSAKSRATPHVSQVT